MTLDLNLTPDHFKSVNDIRNQIHCYTNVMTNFKTLTFNQYRNQIINLTGIQNQTGWRNYPEPVANDGFITSRTAQKIIKKLPHNLNPNLNQFIQQFIVPAANHHAIAYWKC